MWKRVFCALLGHKYAKTSYPDNPVEFLLRCRRCGHQKEWPGGFRPPTAPGGSMTGT